MSLLPVQDPVNSTHQILNIEWLKDFFLQPEPKPGAARPFLSLARSPPSRPPGEMHGSPLQLPTGLHPECKAQPCDRAWVAAS